MSFKEIKELRQAGKLDEALQMANQALETEPENIWNKRAAAWVYYDYLKKNAQPESFEAFKENLTKIKDLQLPEDEKMVFDNCTWQIGSLVFALQKTEHVDYGKINELFEIIRAFHFTKPSEAYSFIYKAFHKGYQNWSSYLTFADWWNLDNLRSEDFLTEEIKGKKIMSIAEQAYIAYSKKLLEADSIGTFGQQLVIDKEKIKVFLPKLDSLIEKHPDYQYPSYFKAKLLLSLGNEENVLSAFLPFAKKKRNDFWVWELMSEIFSGDKEIQFACYCKALSLKTPEDFLVKLRLTFTVMLVEKSMHNEAKTEIQKIIVTREKNEWKLPNQIVQWTEQEWYKSAISKKDNMDLYLSHLKQAEDILFQDIPEEIIAVEFVNENKKILYFIKDKSKYGFFNYSGYFSKPKIGDLLLVRFNSDGQDGYYKVLSAKKADSDLQSEALKNFEGTLKVFSPQNFALIADIFIEPKIVEERKLANGQRVKGSAILSFNKKKNEWGWKAFDVQSILLDLKDEPSINNLDTKPIEDRLKVFKFKDLDFLYYNNCFLIELISTHYPFTTEDLIKYHSILKWGSGVLSFHESDTYYQQFAINKTYGLCFNCNIEWTNELMEYSNFQIDKQNQIIFLTDEYNLLLSIEEEIESLLVIHNINSNPPYYDLENITNSQRNSLDKYYNDFEKKAYFLSSITTRDFNYNNLEELIFEIKEISHLYSLNKHLFENFQLLLSRDYGKNIPSILDSLLHITNGKRDL